MSTPPSPHVRSKPFNIELMRPDDDGSYPIAKVGILRDGSIFVAPVSVRDFGWQYGPLGTGADAEGQISTRERPKVDYHRSGFVVVTLSKPPVPRRSLNLQPLPELRVAQIFSIVVTQPWELQRREPPCKAGNILCLLPPRTQTVAFSLAIMPPTMEGTVTVEDLPAQGVIRGDGSRWFVDLTGHDQEALLIGHNSLSDKQQPGGDLPSIVVTAVDSRARPETQETVGLGLWTNHLRNPSIWLDEELTTATPSWIQVLAGRQHLDPPLDAT